MFNVLSTSLILAAIVYLVQADGSYHSSYNDQVQFRVKRGDFYGPGGLGAGGGGYNFGFVGATFNPVLFQGAAVAGGFANEALKANQATIASGLGGDTFGVSYYAATIANAATANAAALGKHKGGAALTFGR